MSKAQQKKKWKVIASFKDPGSRFGITVSRKGGPEPEYTFQTVQFLGEDENKFSKNLPFLTDLEGEHDLEDIVYSLVRVARERVEKERLQDQARASKGEKTARRKRDKADRPSEEGAKGLSQLAKKDAEAAGHDFVGKTAKKKGKGKS